jgi:hypothetical protein
MSELAAELANILSAVVTQLRGLSDDEVKALAAGEAEFRFVAKKPVATQKPSIGKPARAESTVDFDPAVPLAELGRCTTESEALAYLRGLKLNLATAKALATGLGLRLPARPSVSNIQAEIVRVFVGGRLNAVTVQGL